MCYDHYTQLSPWLNLLSMILYGMTGMDLSLMYLAPSECTVPIEVQLILEKIILFFGEKSMPVVFGAKLSFFSSSHFDSLCIKKKILYFLPKESLTQFSKIEFKWGFRFFVLILLLPFFFAFWNCLFFTQRLSMIHIEFI